MTVLNPKTQTSNGVNITTTSGLKTKILEKVWWIWFWKRAAPLLAIESALVLGVFAGVFSHISPRAILLNALNASDGLRSFVQFFIDNFFVKSIQSRLLLALWLGFLIYAVRDARSVFKRLYARRRGFTFSLARQKF